MRTALLAMLAAPVAAAAQASAQDIEASVQVLTPLTALIPLGISPFLALGLFGAAAEIGGFALPPTLSVLGIRPIWIILLVLAAALQLGRSSKLTKPIVEVVGTSESLVAFLALAMMFVGPAAGSVEAQGASIFGTTLLAMAAATALLAVVLVRMGIDFLTWVSPVPLIDAFLQGIKLLLTVAMVTIAVFFPTFAIVLNVALVVAMAFVLRWLFRVSRFLFAVMWDRVFSALDSATVPVDAERVGPITTWVLGGDVDLPRFTAVHVQWSSKLGWTATTAEEEDAVDLGASADASLDPGFMGTVLTTSAGSFFITSRHREVVEVVSSATGTPVEEGDGDPEVQPA